jgi:hypothetical protein
MHRYRLVWGQSIREFEWLIRNFGYDFHELIAIERILGAAVDPNYTVHNADDGLIVFRQLDNLGFNWVVGPAELNGFPTCGMEGIQFPADTKEFYDDIDRRGAIGPYVSDELAGMLQALRHGNSWVPRRITGPIEIIRLGPVVFPPLEVVCFGNERVSDEQKRERIAEAKRLRAGILSGLNS